MFHVYSLKNVVYLHDNQQVHIYKCVQTHVIIFQQLVLVTRVAIYRVYYNEHVVNIQLIVPRCVI